MVPGADIRDRPFPFAAQIVLQHDGTIETTHADGEGTVITISLPR